MVICSLCGKAVRPRVLSIGKLVPFAHKTPNGQWCNGRILEGRIVSDADVEHAISRGLPIDPDKRPTERELTDQLNEVLAQETGKEQA